jgi:hypothetical protein
MPEKEIAYLTFGDPYSDPPRGVLCPLCGAVVGDISVHTEWHFPTRVCEEQYCTRSDNLKTCGPLGLRCPDHFREP